MASSRTIRIDQEVWAELQKRAQPLEDTPNSVLRRVFGLREEDTRNNTMDTRVASLLELLQDLVGRVVELRSDEKGYAVVGRTSKVIAYIRPQKERLRVAARKEAAEKAGLNNWGRQGQDRFFGATSVRWYIQDGDDLACKRVVEVLKELHELK